MLVATLMAAVGVSVDMQYTESGSGAMSREGTLWFYQLLLL